MITDLLISFLFRSSCHLTPSRLHWELFPNIRHLSQEIVQEFREILVYFIAGGGDDRTAFLSLTIRLDRCHAAHHGDRTI